MKRPIILLMGTMIFGILLSVLISVLFYGKNEVSNSIDAGTKKIVQKEDKDPYEKVDKTSPTISVYNSSTNKIEEMDIETFLYGVLSAEMSSDFSEEALKAQAVAARTYIIYKKENNMTKGHKGADICTDSNHCQAYFSYNELKKNKGEDWRKQCLLWKKKYPVVTEKHYETLEEGCTNIYAFYGELSKVMKENETLMVSVGTSRVAGSQAFQVKKGQRFITNPNTASMGFCLPAATGIAVAQPGKAVVCVTGEGSLQMNIQEMQTILQNRLPVKLFVINNQGYHSIRQTQQSYFKPPLVGVGEESGDLSFPDLSRIMPAYGFPYRAVHASEDLEAAISEVLDAEGAFVCEVFVTKYQKTEPKTSAKKLPEGSMVSAPLEDMYPFLDREELESNMFIPLPEKMRQ